MSDPLVSVLIPCFNGGRFIEETLRSVLSQDHKRLEVIVVDDGSTDNSAAVVRQFANVKLIQQANAGVTTARNVALMHSHGDFIQYLDADDLLSVNKISRQLQRLIGNETCVATAEWGRFYSHPDEARFVPDATWTDLLPLDWLARSGETGLGMMYPALWLIPRGIVDRAGPWNAELGRARGEDMEYFTRIVLQASKVLFCGDARTYYRSGIGGASASKDFRSQVRVYDLCQQYVLASEDSERMRMGFAKSWQHLAYLSYPYDRAVASEALKRARALHPVTIKPTGGRFFEIALALFGWRFARRLQRWSGRP
jgi:glycosyltransferase involved in cell wall biosynthesis